MSVTMMLFRDKPWDNWNPETGLEEVAGYVPLLKDRMFSGTVIHTDIDIRDHNTEDSDLGGQYGYLVIMNDKEVHTDDLFVMFFGSSRGDDPYLLKILVNLQGITKATPADGAQWTTGTLVRFDGGAPFIRNQFANNNRKTFRTVE